MGFRLGFVIGLPVAIAVFYFFSVMSFPSQPNSAKLMASLFWNYPGPEAALVLLLIGIAWGWARGGATLAGVVAGAVIFGELISGLIVAGIVHP